MNEKYDEEQDTSHLKMFCEILFACTNGEVFDTNVYNPRSNLLTFFGSKKVWCCAKLMPQTSTRNSKGELEL